MVMAGVDLITIQTMGGWSKKSLRMLARYAVAEHRPHGGGDPADRVNLGKCMGNRRERMRKVQWRQDL